MINRSETSCKKPRNHIYKNKKIPFIPVSFVCYFLRNKTDTKCNLFSPSAIFYNIALFHLIQIMTWLARGLKGCGSSEDPLRPLEEQICMQQKQSFLLKDIEHFLSNSLYNKKFASSLFVIRPRSIQKKNKQI
jgi:hypothetical protein